MKAGKGGSNQHVTRAFLKSCQTTSVFARLLFCAANCAHHSVAIVKKCQEEVKSLAIFVGFAVYLSKFSIKFTDFKKAVNM